ncbi:MAG: hypothetical protein ACLT33_03260 [Lachnospira pectinoschiza]
MEELSYNEHKRKGSGCEADIYFLVPLTNEQSCEAGRESAIARFVSIGRYNNVKEIKKRKRL